MSFLISKAELEYNHLDYENSSEELIKADLRLFWTGVYYLSHASNLAGLQDSPFSSISLATAKEMRNLMTRALHPDVAFRVYSECGASRFVELVSLCWPAIEASSGNIFREPPTLDLVCGAFEHLSLYSYGMGIPVREITALLPLEEVVSSELYRKGIYEKGANSIVKALSKKAGEESAGFITRG